MAVGFSTDVTFGIVPDDDGYLPYPVPDENGTFTYAASVILEDESAYFDLLSYQSKVTILPAAGGGGLIVVESGRGRKSLTVPLAAGGEEVYYGVLTSISAMARMVADDHIRADCEWVLATSVDR